MAYMSYGSYTVKSLEGAILDLGFRVEGISSFSWAIQALGFRVWGLGSKLRNGGNMGKYCTCY